MNGTVNGPNSQVTGMNFLELSFFIAKRTPTFLSNGRTTLPSFARQLSVSKMTNIRENFQR